MDNKYITISNNIASLSDNALDLLREECTSYTETDKQNKILPYFKELCNIYDNIGDKANIKLVKPYIIYIDHHTGKNCINSTIFKEKF